MKFGIIIPNQSPYIDKLFLRDVAMAAEEAGFDTLLTWDHYNFPGDDRTLDAWLILTYIAANTEKIRLGTCVTPIPFRHPAQLAKIVSSLDILSNGRATLGVGAGWYKPEFDGYSRWYPDSERVSRAIEGVRLILRLWTENKVSFKGRYYHVENTVLEPKPIQKPHPQTWWGTTGKRMLKAAAQMGDGWIPTMISPSTYKELKEKLKKLLQKYGREESFTYAYAEYSTHDRIEDYVKEVEAYEEAGCSLYAATWRFPRKEAIKKIKEFEKIVISSF